MYSYGPSHMAGQKQDNQLELTFSSYVRIWDVALKTCQRRWTMEKWRERVRDICASGTTWWWYIYIHTHTHTDIQPSQLERQNTQTASWQRGKTPSISVLDMTLKHLMWGSSPGVLGNMEYPFIAITPRSTLTQSSSTWSGPIYGPNRIVWYLNWVLTDDLC